MEHLPLLMTDMAWLTSCLLLIFAMAAAPSVTSQSSSNTDLAVLLAFKSQLSDPLHLLANNWTNQMSFCHWTGVSCNKRRRVTVLKLPGVPLQGELTPHLGNLSFLHVLNLTGTGLAGFVPDDLGRLPRLVALDLRNNSFSGTIPSAIGNLTRLQTLSLGLNQFQGSIPNELLNLHNLRNLSLEANYLSGQIPNFSSNSTPSLVFLSSSNNTLSGSIPNSIGSLSMLRYLFLSDNQLTGQAPLAIFNMSRLEVMYLRDNYLSGPIPGNESFKLPMLRVISLPYNSFTGNIPLGLAACRHLERLVLHTNLFVDVVPTWLAQIPKLTAVHLSANSIVGPIPGELSNLTMLQRLDIGDCNLTGQIPLELGKLRELNFLHLIYNQLTGPIPSFIGNLSNLNFLDLGENQLTGPVPWTLGNLRSLEYLSIGYNHLEGNLDFLASLGSCRQLNKLVISSNPFASGSLNPNHVGNLSRNFLIIEADNSQIIGDLPSTLSNLSALYSISFANNQLSKASPESLAVLEKLGELDLSMNSISGPILESIGMLRRLDSLYLHNNMISGSISYGMANLTMLRYLDLSSNKLTSNNNCTSLFHLISIVELNVSNNLLSCALPSNLSYMPSIYSMDLSNNQLVGCLPDSFAKLQMLTYLDFSHNSLDHSIPDSFRALTNLETLDLSSNNLSGTIPNYLSNFSYLSRLNLSFNNLEGHVPNGGVFSNLTFKSLMGNVRLCGGPPHLGFSPCADKSYYPTFGFRLLLFVIRAFAIACLAITVCLCLSRRKKPVVKASIDMAKMIRHRSVSYYEIVRATDNFSEDYLLGAGGFGKVFKGQLDDGTVVAIKVLNMQVVEAMQSFDAECKVLRMARHHNLIRILGVCSNLDFRALLLQYMPNGSLEEHLHTESRPYMGFLTRLGIMLDISMAMEYLHHDHHEVILHCDLKPSNVLLDDEMTARVADFGIAKLLSGQSSLISVSMPGTIGYTAPEYAFMGKASWKSDVFSFGIILLEVFTGKRPTDLIFVEGLSLRQWVSQAFPARLIDVVDRKLLQDEEIYHICFDNQTNTSLGSSSLINTSNSILASVFELGLMCSSESIGQRMSMNEVVTKLEDIKKDYYSALMQAMQRPQH